MNIEQSKTNTIIRQFIQRRYQRVKTLSRICQKLNLGKTDLICYDENSLNDFQVVAPKNIGVILVKSKSLFPKLEIDFGGFDPP